MVKKMQIFLVFFSCLFVAQHLFADQVTGIYQTAVTIADQQPESRDQAIQKAFKQVLMKASGNPVIQESLLSPAQEYVEQYRYQVSNRNEEEKQLWVKFDAGMVRQYLQENGLEQWSDIRPSTLVWLGLDEQGKRTLVNQGLYVDVLNNAGQTRGLPLLFPMMDLEDQTRVLFADVWGDFEETIKLGSSRYDADVILVVRAQQQGSSWSTRWTLYDGDIPKRWESTGDSLPELLIKGANQAASTIASAEVAKQKARSAVAVTTTSVGPQVVVQNVQTLSDYSRVVTYLQGLAQVDAVYPTIVSHSSITLKIAAKSGMERLYAEIESGHVLSLNHTDQGIQLSLNP